MHQNTITKISHFVKALEDANSAGYDPERGAKWAKVMQKLADETVLWTKMIDEVRSIPPAPLAPSKHEELNDSSTDVDDSALGTKIGRAHRGEQRRPERASGVARRHEDARGEAVPTEWGPPSTVSSSSPYDPFSKHSPRASEDSATASPVPHLPAWVSRAKLPKRPQPGAVAGAGAAQHSPPRSGVSPRVPRNSSGGGPAKVGGAAPFGHGRNQSQQNAAPGSNLSPPRIGGKNSDVSSVDGVKPTVPPRRARSNLTGAPSAAVGGGNAAASPRIEPSQPPLPSSRVAPAGGPRVNTKAAVPVQQPPRAASDARPGGGVNNGSRNGWNNGGAKRGQAGDSGGGRGGRGSGVSNGRGARNGGANNNRGSGGDNHGSNDPKLKYSVYCAQEGIPDVPLVESIERDILGQGASVGWDDIADLGEAKELLQVSPMSFSRLNGLFVHIQLTKPYSYLPSYST